ncbi:MAG: nucleotidyltransferase family protein [Dehalococcoidia bacterium]|nr:nucleotidyltransferase family protein [Dehalococcoidia bacterium]
MFAIVLAGGKGERLWPLTSNKPKSMVPILDKPILEYHVEWLRESGVTDIAIACGHLNESIQAHFQDGRPWGVRIQYSIEDKPLGRGGALKLAYRRVPEDEPFVIATNGDNVNTQPLAPMIQQHKRTGAVGTLLLTQLRSPYGIVQQRGKRIVGFREKPLLPHWLSAGVYVLSREFFAGLPDVGDHEDELFPRLAEQGRLYAFRSRAYWKGIDTVKDLNEAAAQLATQAK